MSSKQVCGYNDPNNDGNSASYHTGKPCITPGCNNPAGTAWSPHWCFECNVRRLDGISAQFCEMLGVNDEQ